MANTITANPPTVHPPLLNLQLSEANLEVVLAHGWQLLSVAESFAVAFNLPDLGVVQLPPSLGSPEDQANLRVIAPLYLVAELEIAQVLPIAEILSGLFVSGSLPINLDSSAQLLVEFWQQRHNRLSQRERSSIFARLFGSPSGATLAVENGRNINFEALMIGLAKAIYDKEAVNLSGTSPTSEVHIRLASQQLASNLLVRSGGIVTYAARNLLQTLQEAINILKQVPLQQALGAHSMWQAIQIAAHRYLGKSINITIHVRRGQAGMIILSWLAEILPKLETLGTQTLVATEHPVIPAAIQWLQASTSLHNLNKP